MAAHCWQSKNLFLSKIMDQEDDIQLRALGICRELLGGPWRKISISDISFTPLSGGMSNALYCCSLPESMESTNNSNSVPTSVLLRFYGNQFKDSEISTQVEIFNILSMNNLGPKLYGKFEDGRLEEFLPAISMTNEQLMEPEISSVIAKKLAIVHNLDVPIIDKKNIWLKKRFKEYTEFVKKQNNICYSYSNSYGYNNNSNNNNNNNITSKNYSNNNNNNNNNKQNNKLNYKNLDNYNGISNNNNNNNNNGGDDFGKYLLKFKDDTKGSTKEIAYKLMAINFNKEIKFLNGIFNRTQSPIVFAHNDLHQGNILLAKMSKKRPTLKERIVLIDFEYCSYNYRSYDIANHFIEWTFQYDTPEYPHFNFLKTNFPSEIKQKEFVRNYLEQSKKLDKVSKLNNINGTTTTTTNTTTTPTIEQDEIKIDDEVDELYEEIQPFFMMANFLWTLWSIKSAQCSQINFGYWEHAMVRWQLYKKFKSIYVEQQMKKSWNDNNNQQRRR